MLGQVDHSRRRSWSAIGAHLELFEANGDSSSAPSQTAEQARLLVRMTREAGEHTSKTRGVRGLELHFGGAALRRTAEFLLRCPSPPSFTFFFPFTSWKNIAVWAATVSLACFSAVCSFKRRPCRKRHPSSSQLASNVTFTPTVQEALGQDLFLLPARRQRHRASSIALYLAHPSLPFA